jgi:hypothetical protein
MQTADVGVQLPASPGGGGEIGNHVDDESRTVRLLVDDV